MQSLKSAWRDLAHRSPKLGRSGAVAIITALSLPVLVMMVGFVIDFGYASYINQRLARATDDATLGSVSQTAATAGGGYGNLYFLQIAGVSYFNANIADLGLTGVNFALTVTSDGNGGVTAKGNYNFKVPTFFAAALGFNSIAVSGNATTSGRPPTYINYYILVDNSPSMGIAATPADMMALYQRVLAYNNAAPANPGNSSSPGDGGCVFACHNRQRIGTFFGFYPIYSNYTNEDLAHNTAYGTPITLRLDSAVSAVNTIVGLASSIAGATKNIKFGIYTIGEDSLTGRGVQFIVNPPTTNYAAVKQALPLIDLVNTDETQNTGNTDFHDEITDFLAGIVPPMAQGSGASATSPLNYVFLVTDGLNDVRGNCNGYQLCTAPINNSDCDTLKKNATVGVIYTTYAPIYQYNTAPTPEVRYNTIVTTSKPAAVRSALQACATSSDFFFEAQDGPTIVSAMQTLFQRTQPVSARISQ